MQHINHRILLVGITFAALALRLLRLDFQPLWWDEGYSVFFATRDFWTMLERTAMDIHPPLYYALLQSWVLFVGKSDVAVRLLSVVVGVAAIPLIYTLARKLFDDPRIALIAALLLAISPFHIYYSQQVRMYGLVTLLGLASVYLCVQLLGMIPGQPATAATTLAYILVTAGALYTQYYAAFILASEMLLVLAIYLRIDRRPLDGRSFASVWANPLAHWLGAWAVISALYLPWLIYAGPKLYAYVISKVGIEQYAPLDPITFLAQHLAAFSTGHLTEWTWLGWGSIGLIALAGFAIVADTRRRGNTETPRLSPYPLLSLSPSLLVLFWLFIPLTLGYLVNLVFPFHPVHGERLLLLAAPAFYLIAAIGIVMVWNHRPRFGILALIVIGVIAVASLYDFYRVPRYPKDDYRPLLADLRTVAQPNDVLLAIYPWQIGYLETYYTPRGAPLNIVETPNDAWIKQPSQMQRELDALLKKNSRVWILALQTQGRIVEDALEAYLRPRAYLVIDNWHGTTRLEMFALADDSPGANRPLEFGNELTIANWGISADKITAGQDFVRVWLDASNATAGAFKASLRLVDAQGNLWTQDDREITGGAQRVGLFVPLGTPPGEYDMRLAAYRARDGTPLRVGDRDDILLARVQVTVARPNLAAVPQRAEIDFGNGIRLVGNRIESILRPGEPASITLFWQATRAIDKDYAVVTQIQDTRGNVYATTQAAPAHGIYPTTRWQANEIVRDPQTVTLRGDTPDGNYRIVVALIDTTNNARTQSIDVGTVSVKGRPHYFGAPSPSNKFDARFGDVARLVGYDVISDQRAVRVVLYWQAMASSKTAYKVFAHLVDSNGTLRAQRDQIPGNGVYPTTSWVKDEFLVDVYDIELPRDAPPGEYSIRIGMYEPATNTRLPVFDGSSQLLGDYSELSMRIPVK